MRFRFRRQCRDVRGASGPSERSARQLRSQASHRDPRNHQFVGGPQRGRERRGVKRGERTLRVVEAPDEQEAPDLEIARMRGIDAIAVRFERGPRGFEPLRRPPQLARDQCDLRLGNDTPRAGNGLSWPEGTRSTSQKGLRSNQIAELRHRSLNEPHSHAGKETSAK